jgi:hypothetical protein
MAQNGDGGLSECPLLGVSTKKPEPLACLVREMLSSGSIAHPQLTKPEDTMDEPQIDL